MKPRLEVVHQQNQVFQITNVREFCFSPLGHFYPKCEVGRVPEGPGIRLVANRKARFQAGNLVYYGSDIPHLCPEAGMYYPLARGYTPLPELESRLAALTGKISKP